MKLSGICILTALILFLSGCRHKDLEDEMVPTQRIRVEYDWNEAPDADPEGMCAFFYNSATGDFQRFDLPGKKGGYVDLPYGDWHVITYNNDMPGVQFYGHDAFHTHTAYTREGNVLEEALGNNLMPSKKSPGSMDAPRVKGSEDEKVVITPDMMWGHACQNIGVHYDSKKQEQVITLVPHEMVCTYSYDILNVENLEHVTNMCAAISGMAGEIGISDENVSDQPVTLPIPAWKNGATTISGQFYTFGHHSGNNSPHKMTLYVWMDDGTKLAYGTEGGDKWDVSSQIDNATNRKRVHYVINGLDLPVKMNNGGLNASTDDWGSEYHDITM